MANLPQACVIWNIENPTISCGAHKLILPPVPAVRLSQLILMKAPPKVVRYSYLIYKPKEETS